MSSNAMDDLKDAIERLQVAFRQYQIEPAIIELASWEEGRQIKTLLDREHFASLEDGKDLATGDPVNQITIAGTIVRWPTLRRRDIL